LRSSYFTKKQAVAGEYALGQATAEALSELEIAGRSDIPVYIGSNRPLVHQVTDWVKTTHQTWWSDDPVVAPPGGYAKTRAEKESAVSYLVNTVNANPGQITIVVIGPLTNIALAIRQSPDFAKNVKQLNIMGGAFGWVGGVSGNITPNAEFNFWVDPEAAQVVIRSGIPISLTPLNMARAHNGSRHLTDELAVASVIDPTLVKVKDLYVDVDVNHGPDYGASLSSPKLWEGGEGATQISVQYDVDYDRLMKLYADRLASYDSRITHLAWDRTKK
jgi:inosine-uridine nucleoside N-ribohydrolase